mmetsp:Transcript_8759/g.13159  ORF Transcript_8759/g.13159 Transcript_8759/m.13159 type:complete len:85 (-) Transcript_8759:113-367(-)
MHSFQPPPTPTSVLAFLQSAKNCGQIRSRLYLAATNKPAFLITELHLPYPPLLHSFSWVGFTSLLAQLKHVGIQSMRNDHHLPS